MFSHKMHCYKYIIRIPFELWTNFRGYACKSSFKITERKNPVRIIYNSEYLAHSELIFKTLQLFKIDDLYKLKLMKFYYNLS